MCQVWGVWSLWCVGCGVSSVIGVGCLVCQVRVSGVSGLSCGVSRVPGVSGVGCKYVYDVWCYIIKIVTFSTYLQLENVRYPTKYSSNLNLTQTLTSLSLSLPLSISLSLSLCAGGISVREDEIQLWAQHFPCLLFTFLTFPSPMGTGQITFNCKQEHLKNNLLTKNS